MEYIKYDTLTHALVFIYGNRNYGRITIKPADLDYYVNDLELYRSNEVGVFRAMQVVN